jgi:predicted  nucleic acid-binding Zn-ribbon protein
MLPALAALVALQRLDSAADSRRRRLGELPAAEQALDQAVSEADRVVAEAKVRLADNHQQRRTLEKDVAGVDSRLARFEDHRAAVKTNQEYTALLHEIAGAKAEKDGLEDRILLLMEEADRIASEIAAAETAAGAARAEAATAKAALAAERQAIEADLAGLAAERADRSRAVDSRTIGLYAQLLKNRRGIAVATLTGDTCAACYVRLRPHITQLIRRNEEIVQCESCQRILYFEAPIPV